MLAGLLSKVGLDLGREAPADNSCVLSVVWPSESLAQHLGCRLCRSFYPHHSTRAARPPTVSYSSRWKRVRASAGNSVGSFATGNDSGECDLTIFVLRAVVANWPGARLSYCSRLALVPRASLHSFFFFLFFIPHIRVRAVQIPQQLPPGGHDLL